VGALTAPAGESRVAAGRAEIGRSVQSDWPSLDLPGLGKSLR
jgi:hypothetical protein